jgi:hypothetical protein
MTAAKQVESLLQILCTESQIILSGERENVLAYAM